TQSAASPRRECPDRDTLMAFNTGRLSEFEMERLAEHIGTCNRCEQTLQELLRQPADSFEAKLLRVCADLSSREQRTQSDTPLRAPFEAATRTDDGRGKRATTELPESKTLGPYRLGEIIGHGGMGVVYRALHVVLNRTFALKTLHAGSENRKDTFDRFQREGKAIARLVHQ